MTETPLDTAFAAHAADPEDEAAHLRFLERVMDAELRLLLEAEPTGERLAPRVFDLEAGRFVLTFDTDARLAAFLEAPAPYAALPGRRAVAMLAEAGLGLALNPGVAPSETLLPADAVAWLAERNAQAPRADAAAAREIGAPGALDAALLVGLDAKLRAMAGMVQAAYLASARYVDGREGLLLGVVGVPEAAEPAVAAGIAETMRFSGADGLDVAFLREGSAQLARMASVAVRIDVPDPPQNRDVRVAAPPGSDPARPPKLR